MDHTSRVIKRDNRTVIEMRNVSDVATNADDLRVLKFQHETGVAGRPAPNILQSDNELGCVIFICRRERHSQQWLLPSAKHVLEIEVLHLVKTGATAFVIPVLAKLGHVRSRLTFWNERYGETAIRGSFDYFMPYAVDNWRNSWASEFVQAGKKQLELSDFRWSYGAIDPLSVVPSVNSPHNDPACRIRESGKSSCEVSSIIGAGEIRALDSFEVELKMLFLLALKIVIDLR